MPGCDVGDSTDMVEARRGWTTLAAAGLVLAVLESWACRQDVGNRITAGDGGEGGSSAAGQGSER